MIKILSQNGKIAYGVKEYIIDKKEELNTYNFQCDMGSSVFIIETQETYILNGKNEWILKE